MIHLALSLGGLVLALLMVGISIAVTSNVLGKTCDGTTCQSMLYITTTFLSSKRIETSLGFPVATERDLTDSVQTALNDPTSATRDRGYRFGHFYECMYTARMVDRTCSPSLTLNEYTACIQNTSTVGAALDACAAFPTVGGYSHWPTSEEYLACLWNNPLLQNSEVRRASQNVFRACLEQSLWPFFEVPQGIDSPVLFGSFNWGMLLLAGVVVLSSFAVYTCSPVETGTIEKGESQAFMRLGILSSGTALLWNIVFFVLFNFVAFRSGTVFQDNGGLPTTATTSFVTIVGLGAAVLYFLAVTLKPFGRGYAAIKYSAGMSSVAKIEPVHTGEVISVHDHESHGLLKSTFPDAVNPAGVKVADRTYTLGAEDVAKMYTPPLLAIWSDSYMLDFCFFLGIAGATGQLSTDVAWNLFVLTFAYRLLGMILGRCISDAFTNNVRLEALLTDYNNQIQPRPSIFFYGKRVVKKEKGEFDVHLSPKVIGLSTQLAALFLYISVMYLVFNGDSAFKDFGYFNSFVICGFAIPEGLRLLVHVYYQFSYDADMMGDVPWMLYNSFFVVWLWDVGVRAIFTCIVFFEASNNPGTFDFLKTQTNALMRDYILAYSL